MSYEIGELVTRPIHVAPYLRKPSDPLYRPLKIFTRDPATSLLDGSIETVNVPYEPLEMGPQGKLITVACSDEFKLDLEDRSLLINNGLDPSPSDVRFPNQMLYAICSTVYASFRKALGRSVAKMPKQGSKRPWRLYQNYAFDIVTLRFGKVDDGVMQYS